jgi:hypothetical protein
VSDFFRHTYEAAGAPLWTRQAGTSVNDFANGVAVDSAGNAYIAGYTRGSLGGPSAGQDDYFLAKYDGSGALLWTRQAGTSAGDRGLRVAVDAAGNAYVAGVTNGSLGGPSAGTNDYFLVKYDASGALLWTRQAGSPGTDVGHGVAVDGAGNAYIAGFTEGLPGGGPYAGSYDAFLAKYDASGAVLWTRQAGTSGQDVGRGVAVDGTGNAYIAGYTEGSLGGPNVGGSDYFLAKYDASGALLWMRQAGTSGGDFDYGVAVDGAGNASIAGETQGSLGGPNAGGSDYFLAKYGPPTCYPNCDSSVTPPVLNVGDFTCFLQRYAAGDSYANCDGSTQPPILNVADFTCFLNAFAADCS